MITEIYVSHPLDGDMPKPIKNAVEQFGFLDIEIETTEDCSCLTVQGDSAAVLELTQTIIELSHDKALTIRRIT